jgi:choline dehydrogenase-like flavoprotein
VDSVADHQRRLEHLFPGISADSVTETMAHLASMGPSTIGSDIDARLLTAFWSTSEGRSLVGFPAPDRAVMSPSVLPSARSRPSARRYDAVVIGAGAGGGVVAALLAEAGKSVLALERGRALDAREVGHHPLRNQRMMVGGLNAGPDYDEKTARNVRVVDTPRGPRTVLPWDDRFHANAATVGGGTRVYGAQAWRFHAIDFRMASTYGIPPGSSLADWPITYEDLTPHYTSVEHELGVAGAASQMTHLRAYEREYPMPPVAGGRRAADLRAGATALGWSTLTPPLAINTIAREGRPACIQCAYCVGFACGVDAKNGTQNTYLPRAVTTGRCELIEGATATEIILSGTHASGVRVVADGVELLIDADVVVCAAGAIETARLLLLSGVANPMLGRNLQGHVYVAAFGQMDHEVWDGIGPGPTIATSEWLHGNDGVIGGGMLLDDFVMLPAAFWRIYPGGADQTGDSRTWLPHAYRSTIDVKGPIQDIPSPDARVTLDPVERDHLGVPVARLSGATHAESIRAAQFLADRAVEWLVAAGASKTWRLAPNAPYLSAGQHQAGTARMGNDASSSVVDPWNRVHGYDNLLVTDTSVHVTNGGVNPFLTAMALADRAIRELLSRW